METRKSCQEKAGIVTGLMGKPEKLSRKDRNCDRFDGKARKAVNIKPELRQVWMETWKSCQNKAVIKTGLDGNTEKLSRKSLNCDRFDGKASKAVKIKPELRQL